MQGTDKTAVALFFDGVNAPWVSASGSNRIGEQIIRLAREYDIPVHEDAALASALSRIPLGEEIPRELYLAVAEVLAFVYYLDEIQLNGTDI
jgi:flagellar biosynthesis protein